MGRTFVMIIGKQTSYWSKTGFFLLSLPVEKGIITKHSLTKFVDSEFEIGRWQFRNDWQPGRPDKGRLDGNERFCCIAL